MPLADNFFACKETPLWAPNLFDIESIPQCTSCTLRLTSKQAGVGNLQEGLTFQESPLTTLAVNGIDHNVVNSFLTIPGAHKFGNIQEPASAELFFVFQNTKVANKRICLCIPLDIGVGPGNAYFSTLTTDIRNDRPTMATLLTPNGSFLSYDGASIVGRSADNSTPSQFCDVPSVVTFYVSRTNANILQADYLRFVALHPLKPPKPTGPAGKDRMYSLCTRIVGIRLDDTIPTTASAGIPTKAMKCVRLNSKTDIVDDKVYVGKNKPGTTLSEELAKAASGDDSKVLLQSNHSSSLHPQDIEQTIGILLGVILGLVVASTIAVFIYTFIYKRYAENQLYTGVPTMKSFAVPIPPLPGFFSKS